MEFLKSENLKWIVIFILALLFLNQCNKGSNNGSGTNDQRDTVVVQLVDTVTFTKIDTIPFYDTIPRYVSIEVPEPVITEDSSGNLINTYVSTVTDSLIDGKLTTVVNGTLLSTSFEYKPLFPKYI